MYVHTDACGNLKAVRTPDTWVPGSCGLPKLSTQNTIPLQEQQVFLTSKPCLRYSICALKVVIKDVLYLAWLNLKVFT